MDFVDLNCAPADVVISRQLVRAAESSEVFTPKTFLIPSVLKQTSVYPVQLLEIQNVWVTPDTTMFVAHDFTSCYYEKVEEDGPDNNIIYNTKNLLLHSQRLAKINNLARLEIQEEVLFLGGTFCTNYFHFLIEILSKFEFIDRIPNFKEVTIVVHQGIADIQNLQDLLVFFNIGNKILYLSQDHYYRFSKIWHFTYANVAVPNIGEGQVYQAEFAKFSRQSVDFLRRTCLENLDLEKVKIQPIQKIFLARKSQFRKYNEPELLAVVEQYDFKAIYFEDLNIHEQLFLMQNAEFIVGASGAAWTNIIFCKSGKTKGLIWLANSWKDFSVFSTLANFSGVDLFHWRFGEDSLGLHQDYSLDLNAFESQLKQLLSYK